MKKLFLLICIVAPAITFAQERTSSVQSYVMEGAKTSTDAIAKLSEVLSAPNLTREMTRFEVTAFNYHPNTNLKKAQDYLSKGAVNTCREINIEGCEESFEALLKNFIQTSPVYAVTIERNFTFTENRDVYFFIEYAGQVKVLKFYIYSGE